MTQTTAGSTHQHSGQPHAITSGGHTSISAGKSLLASAERAIRMFSYKTGIRLISAVDKLEFTAVEKAIHLLAKVRITATAQRLHIEAKEEIVVNGGGSYSTWKAEGIQDATAGVWEVHAGSHSMPGARAWRW